MQGRHVLGGFEGLLGVGASGSFRTALFLAINLGVATPAEPRGEKKTFFFCANFGR